MMTVALEKEQHPIVVVDLDALCTVSRKGNAVLAKGALEFLKQLPSMSAHQYYIVSDKPQRQLAEVQNVLRANDMATYGLKALITAEHHPHSNSYQHVSLVIEQGGLLSSAVSPCAAFYPFMPDNVYVIAGSDKASAEALQSGAHVLNGSDHDFARLTESLEAAFPARPLPEAANDIAPKDGLRGIFARRHDHVEEEQQAPSAQQSYDAKRVLALIAQ